MSTRRLLTGNGAAAWGARLADVDYVPGFPITPQTEILDALAEWIARGEIPTRLTVLESEHSMVTAAAAAAATGVRVFTATSSQGLLHAMEMLYAAAGGRAPFVLVNVSRGVAAPITLESDHQDVLAARDAGFLQIHCASAQEVLDSVLLAYRVSEDARVRLPAIVNLDGFSLSFTREPVDLPEPTAVREWLPAPAPDGLGFRASRPLAHAVAVLGGTPYSYFRYQIHLAAEAAAAVYDEAARSFADRFGRMQPAVESHRTEDAEIVLVVTGSLATRARATVDRLRDAGERVGLVRPRLLRPLPIAALRGALAGRRGVAVLDQSLSIGMGGVLHAEIARALYGSPGAPPVLASFVGGLGGREIASEELEEIVAETHRAAEAGRTPPPRLLFTEAELREVRRLQAIANAASPS